MRWPTVNCILLACITSTLAADAKQGRSKRDLQFIKDVIAAKLGLTQPKPVQKDEDVKIFRIPGFDQVVVRAVPKVAIVEAPMPERIVQVDPTLAIIGSYLGTKSAEETLFALQGMKQLMHSGVMTARQEVVEMAPPRPPVYVLPPPVVQQKLDCPEPRPVYPIFQKTVVPMLQPMPMPVLPPVPVLPPPPVQLIPAPANVVVPQISSVPMQPIIPVPVIPTRYLYKQVNTDGSITSYLSEGNQDVIITETNKPLPPPPPYIIERLQKIIYGKNLENPVPVPSPAPEFSNTVFGPFYSQPLMPIITEPSDVEVKLNHSNKTHEESKVKKNSSTSTIVQEKIVLPKPLAVDVPVGPLVIPPKPVVIEAPEDEEDGEFYRHVHADGSITTYMGTPLMREPFNMDRFEHFSELPSPEPLQKAETATEQAHKPKAWGYSLKMSNGIGSYESLDGGKIYYSRLETPPTKPQTSVLPDPLSSLTDGDNNSPNKNVILVGNDEEIDEFGNPFISTQINSETGTITRPGIEPIKKMPPLPMPIAGDSYKTNVIGATKYSFKIETNPNSPDTTKYTFSTETPSSQTDSKKNSDYHGFGSEGFSYTQVNHDGTVDIFTGTGKETIPAIAVEAVKQISALPTPIVAEQPIAKPPAISKNIGENNRHSYSYKQTNKEGSVTTISGDNVPGRVLVAEKVPAEPAAIIDVIQSTLKGPCKPNKICKEPSSGYSYTHINNEGSVTKITGDGQVKMPIVPAVPVAPVAVIDVIQPLPQTQSVLVEVADKNPPKPVMFAKPVWSNYIYKQISHTNPQPFTVVKVGDGPDIEVPVADVHVKVNRHEHVRPDGTTYLCTEVHKVAPDAPIPPIPTAEVISTVPEELIYVPPLNADAPLPASQNVEMNSSESHFSYTQVSSGSSTQVPSTTTEVSQTEESSSDEPTSFNLNPIIVAPLDSKYSYTQIRSDGSSLIIEGDNENSISETFEHGETKPTDSERGDIPEASE